MGIFETMLMAIASQVVIAVVTVQRHKVHIDYMRADIKRVERRVEINENKIYNLQSGVVHHS